MLPILSRADRHHVLTFSFRPAGGEAEMAPPLAKNARTSGEWMLPILPTLRQTSLDPDDDGEQRGLWARRRPQQEEELTHLCRARSIPARI
jgi:hypothetical protein